MKPCSTRDAAKALDISLVTLQRYIAAKKVTPPKLQQIGGVTVRLWSRRDIERVRRQIKKA